MRLAWKVLYDDGLTLEEIALEYGAKTSTVRWTGLLALGTRMRRPGQRAGTTHQNDVRVEAAKHARGDAFHTAFAGTRGAHRRRGGRVSA
jgi:hypothetical protein